MILAAYLTPLCTVSDGMYAGSKINPLYFLTINFWKQGIVALPSHDESFTPLSDDNEFDLDRSPTDKGTLVFHGCMKKFEITEYGLCKKTVTEKVIGPMNLKLEPGKITTLLGPNGVGTLDCYKKTLILILVTGKKVLIIHILKLLIYFVKL